MLVMFLVAFKSAPTSAFLYHTHRNSRTQWSRGLRRVWSWTAQALGSRVPNLVKAWMYILVFLCCAVLYNYGLDDRGSIPGRGNDEISSPHSNRLWGPLSLLSNVYRVLLPLGQSGRGVKFTTHLHLVLKLRMRGAIPPLPPKLCCVDRGLAMSRSPIQGVLTKCLEGFVTL
jgi:hypothetical protein